MPKLIHNVTLELFSHDQDISAFKQWAPIPIEEVLATQWKWHPDRPKTQVYDIPKKHVNLWVQETESDEGPMFVYHYRFSKQRDTTDFIEKLRQIEKGARQEILMNVEKHMDAKGRLLLRLDKKAVALAEKDCVFAKVNLAAFPKNEETCKEIAKEVLS